MIELAGRFLRWVLRLFGGLTLLRLLLLGLTLVSVGRGLAAVVGHLYANWIIWTAVLGILIGWLLGRSRLPGWGSGLVAAGYGMVWLILGVGRIAVPAWQELSTFPSVYAQYYRGQTPDFVPMQTAYNVLAQSVADLSNRFMLWFQNVGARSLSIDPIVTTLFWALALWTASAWAAWWMRRREALGVALLPAIVLLAYNVYFTNSRFGILWLVLAGGGWLLLQAVDSYSKARRRWREHHMDRTDIELTLAGMIVLLATGLMLAGGLLPSVSIQKISDAFQHIFQGSPNNPLAESLGLQSTPEVALVNGGGSGLALSDSHGIGPGPKLSQEVVMYVTVEGYQPPPPPDVLLHTTLPQPTVRYYWRSETFDEYNGHVWVDSATRAEDIAADAPYHPNLTVLPANYQEVHQEVQRLVPLDDALFVAGDLLSADQPSVASWRASGDLIYAQTPADTYTATSRIQYVSVDQLRTAGSSYPSSLSRYLELPDELPERVRDLAVRLTINEPTAYDKANAIESYLRQFPYSLDVPGAPTDRDAADYFLFDLQKGYCDYYATTMAVMARAAGLPSRLVTGYTSGDYDYTNRRFVVVAANAHSWVEIYFPGIGWVEFEPTTNEFPFPHPGQNEIQNSTSIALPTSAGGTPVASSAFDWSWLRFPFEAIGIALAGLLVFLLLRRFLPLESWQLSMRPSDKAVKTIYHRLYHQARSWGVVTDAARTPHEFAVALSASLQRRASRRMAPAIAALVDDLDWLTGLYTRLLFGQHQPTPDEHHQAIRTWRRLQRGLLRLRV